MLGLIFDTECNSLDTQNGYVQELAWILVDTTNWRNLKSVSHLIRWNTAYEVDAGALNVTGLTQAYCEKNGETANRVFTDFLYDASLVDFVCGHNLLGYDDPIIKTNVKRACGYDIESSQYSERLKLDTLLDCPYPTSMKIHSLRYLAYDHGYILTDAHQALADVGACKHLLSKYPLEQVIEIAKTPMVTLTTKIDWDDVASRDRVKNARFYWNPIKKLWEKRVRAFHLTSLQLTLGTGIALSEEGPARN